MQNAHQRLGRLEYLRSTEKTNTQIFLHVDRYIGDEKQAHLLSLFGGDAEVGAIRAAIYEKHTFTLTMPEGEVRSIGFGPDAVCYNGTLSLRGRKRSLRHMIALSAPLHANGTAGQTFIPHLATETKGLVWATAVSMLGLPADPRWGSAVLGEMRKEKRIRLLDGIGCKPAVIHGTREEFMARIGRARAAGLLSFPEKNGPVFWPNYRLRDVFASSLLDRKEEAA